MEINADNSRVDFYLYDDYGNLLWSNNLTTTMPNQAVRAGVACRGTNASATPIMTFDYTSIAFSGLVR